MTDSLISFMNVPRTDKSCNVTVLPKREISELQIGVSAISELDRLGLPKLP